MELKYNINELYNIVFNLERQGYVYKKRENDTLFFNHKDEVKREVVLKPIINYREYKTIMPDYNDSSLTVVSSIDNYFGYKNDYTTCKDLDELLNVKKPKHIAYILLDGFGASLIKSNLKDGAILKEKMVRDMSAVYPSTTACAIPAFTSGLEPIVTGWTGWTHYFKKLDTDIIMFNNRDYFTFEEKDINTREELPYTEFYKKYDFSMEMGPEFYGKENGFKSFKKLTKAYLKRIKAMDKSFSYIYWGEPDHTFHIKGTSSKKSIRVSRKLNKIIEKMYKKMDSDTLLIVSADHGHLDSFPIYLYNYKDIVECFERYPSVEGRALEFKIKEDSKEKFESLFDKYFGAYYTLYTKEEFFDKKFLGNSDIKCERLDEFFGDYVAVATNGYYFVYQENYDDSAAFRSHHAGLTEKEMRIPLIFIYKQ